MKKIALVGAAHIHAPQFVENMNSRKDDFLVAGVWDHDPARAEKYAAQLQCPLLTSDDQIWSDPTIDCVVIYAETNRHRDLIRKAAAAKKDMFVEKPLGFTAADAKEAARLIKDAGVLFQTGYFMRGNPAVQFLKKQMEQGAFGTVTSIRYTNCHSGSLGGWFDTDYRWMANPAIAGCGAFGDLGTHALDIILWLTGKLPAKAAASIRTITGRYENCDETGEALLVFPDGMTATIAAGWVDVANPVTCEISGTKGHAVIVNGELFFKSELVPGADNDRTPWTALPESLPHAFQIYLDAVCGKTTGTLITPEEAADRNLVMEAIYRSAETGNMENI